jgi:uncharacterized protein YjbI with pentapeptide repeats
MRKVTSALPSYCRYARMLGLIAAGMRNRARGANLSESACAIHQGRGRAFLFVASLALAAAQICFAQDAIAQPSPTCPSSTGTGKNFAGQDLTDHNFRADPPGSLVGANFSNAKLSGAVFAGQDLTNAKFQSANLGPARGPVDFTQSILTNTCFVDAVMDQTDFSYAIFTCTDFSGTSLMQATFGPLQDFRTGNNCRTKFVAATLDVHLITEDLAGKSNWSKSDFSWANFQNLSAATFNLRGKDITGAILAHTNFSNIDMTGANLTDVDFTKATLTKATFNASAINGAVFYNAQAEAATFVCAQGFGNAGGKTLPNGQKCPAAPTSTDASTAPDFTLAGLKNSDFTAATLDHVSFPGANLNGGTFTNASLVQANLQSTVSRGVPTGTAQVQFAIFTGADFKNAQLASVDFSGGNLAGAIFDGTSLNGTNFAGAVMPGASFQSNASLQSVNFTSAILQNGKFKGVRIQAPGQGGGFGANFSCSQLGGSDFGNATITGTNFGNAVMPAVADCCPAKNVGGQPWCGVVAATQDTYAGVTFPILQSPNTCPDGSTALCTGTQWRLSPSWQTQGCNIDRVMQTMWSQPNCSGTPGEIVVFKDQNLKKCILETLPGQNEVQLATAQQIAQVSCPGRGIADITGLEAFISLAKLDLSSNALPIFTLAFTSNGNQVPSKLQTLNLSNNQITTLDLTAHAALMSLSASHNAITSLSLSANAYLVVLDVSHNAMTAFNLPIQTSLAYADLSHNRLADVLNQWSTDLSALTGLSYLDLSHNTLTTIGSIKTLAWNRKLGRGGALQSLFLGCNADFRCGDLGVYDGTQYPAASTSLCTAYDAPESKWVPLTRPTCPPG